MASITSDTYLDGGTARTQDEGWTINGGVLTIRTDTRWHENAPVGMTGSLGAVAITSGGVLIDARNVRWLPYDTGSGNVPAIGTSITQGGITGYLLGVWPGLNSAPVPVGDAMPISGFIKFREVTGGNYEAGALTGIGANATGPDVLGWIEVVQRQAVANTVPRRGFYRTRGGWFYLDNTTGIAGQQIQIPTNGGGVGTRVPGVWIETGVGTDEYEHFTGLISTFFNTTNLGTDTRAKFVLSDENGVVRIGGDGTDTMGYLPPAGCRVRIPNILGRQTLAGAGSVNLTPHPTLATRPDFATTAAGEIDFEYFMNDWYHAFTSPYKVRIVNCATFDIHTTANEATPTDIDNYIIGAFNGTSVCLTGTNNSLGGSISNCSFIRGAAASNGHSISLSGCLDLTLSNIRAGVVAYARSTGRMSFSQCRNVSISNLISFCTPIAIATCQNFNIADYDYTDRINGETITTTPVYAIYITVSSDNITFDGISLGLNGTIANLHPYAGLANASNCSNVTIRNGGSLASPMGGSTNASGSIYVDSGNNSNFRIQRIYLNTRSGLYSVVNTSKNFAIENCLGSAGTIATAGIDTFGKGLRLPLGNSTVGQASCYGSHWFDVFTSDTTGRIWLAFNEPTGSSQDQYEAVVLGAGSSFTSVGNLALINLGDQVIFTSPYFMIGHTGFQNVNATLTGTNTGNFSYEYDLDKGSGFSGTFQTLSGANLSAETGIDPSIGVKVKLRITVTTASLTNLIRYIRLDTDSTLVAQGNLYPLDYTTINLSGIVPNSRVQIRDLTNDVEIYNQIVTGTTLNYASPFTGNINARIRVMFQDGVEAKKIVEFTELITISGITRVISQEPNTIYEANAIDGSEVTGIEIVDAELLIKIDRTEISWAEIYAYETYHLSTQVGIREQGRSIEAVDTANYRINNFKIKNISDPSLPLVINGGYGVDGTTRESIDIIDITGGTIILAPDHVVAFQTSSSGGGDGATAAEIWNYSSRTLTSGSAPSAAAIASQVRTELATELARIDASITSRLASGTYVAPDNSGISDIELAISNLNDLSTSDIDERLDARLAAYDAPTKAELDAAQTAINTEINANKTKIDLLQTAISELLIPTTSQISTAVWAAATRSLTDKANFTLSSADKTAIATAVEAAIINEGDGQQVVNAILQVFNSNLDLPSLELAAIAQAVRSELTTELGRIDAAITSRLASGSYVAPDNAGINSGISNVQSAISGLNDLSATDIDNRLAAYDAPTKTEMDEALTIINSGLKKASLLIPHTDDI